MSKGKDDAPHELESQFVLRLPPVSARSVRSHRAAPGPARLAGQHRLPQAVTRRRGLCGSGLWKQAGCFGAWVAPSQPFERVVHGLP